MGQELNIEEICRILPHRFPFLLVDKLVELVPGEKAVGIKNVTFNEPFFQGHFPGEPIMPGVLIIEAMAQVGALALLSKEDYYDRIALLTGINKFRFKKSVRPGDQLIMELALKQIREPFGRGAGTARVNGELVASGELTFVLANRKENLF